MPAKIMVVPGTRTEGPAIHSSSAASSQLIPASVSARLVLFIIFIILLNNPESKMGSSTWEFGHLQSFQLDLSINDRFKRSQTAAEEDWHDVNMQFISKPGFQTLLCSIRRPNDIYIFVARNCSCLLDGTFDAI